MVENNLRFMTSEKFKSYCLRIYKIYHLLYVNSCILNGKWFYLSNYMKDPEGRQKNWAVLSLYYLYKS